jgi:hypothetical protein
MRYFFDVSGAGQSTRDTYGLELVTREDAAAQAAELLAEIALHHLWGSGEATLTLLAIVREGQHDLLESRLTVGTSRMIARSAPGLGPDRGLSRAT